ncbi:MAG: Asp-tRNA(Asn)/Glu-tRNA(Gln) amidotransferase subunit GatA [Peptococcaceae bacterium]
MELYYYPAHQLHQMLVKKEIKAEEICLSVLNRVSRVEDKIKAFITLTHEQALVQAKKIDEKIARKEKISPLAGIPVAIKDNICTEGLRTTCASRILENFIPPYNATVINLLNQADAVIIGKTNLDEFAMGSSTENSAFFTTANPWDLEKVPGGSSGGSAAAVAAGETILALGSDTGGSIRQPAAFCGVLGLKPTYGLVSRFGLVAFASSLDQIGPFARDAEDLAWLLNVISGYDPLDSTSRHEVPPDYTDFLVDDVRGLRIGIPREYMVEGIDVQVKQVINQALAKLTALGATAEEVSLPHSKYALPTYYLIAPAEASSNLARYDGVRYGFRADNAVDMIDMFKKTRSQGFGEEVKRRIMLGTYALSAGYYDAYYLKALKVRTLIKQDFEKAFSSFDVLVSPVTPTPAFKKGEKTGDPLQMYMSDICTLAINLAGIPGLAIPAGFVNGLPVGMQLLGKPFSEGILLQVAHIFEQNTGFHLKKPALKVFSDQEAGQASSLISEDQY